MLFSETCWMHLPKNSTRAVKPARSLPHLAALVCCSPFDIALHDAYGTLHGLPVYKTYNSHYMSLDLAEFISPAPGTQVNFRNLYPAHFLTAEPASILPVWHLVGGLDPIDSSDATNGVPHDGYPVFLGDWIERDGLYCLKIKLRGDDADWDYDRLVRVGRLGRNKGVRWLSADFNCTVREPTYVNEILIG